MSEEPVTKAPRAPVVRWLEESFLGLKREFRWAYLPPLMVYLAAGISGLTAIVGTFFIKEHLGLSAAFLAGLAFWAGIPWTLKMPLGHLVDIIWRWKSVLVYIGASLIACGIGIMYGLIVHAPAMTQIMTAEAWYVLSALLAPTGYVVQDVVADAMTVEAVPLFDEHGDPYPDDQVKLMHTTMQTLGRVAIVTGLIVVAILNISMFSGVADMSATEKTGVYANIYLFALVIPAISVLGAALGDVSVRLRARRAPALETAVGRGPSKASPNWWIFGGSIAFVAVTLTVGLSEIPLAQELVFGGSLAIVLFLMNRLFLELDPAQRRTLLGTALIIFVFRATPLPGPGATWWEIDVLAFDQQFLSVLSLITSALALAGMILFRLFLAKRSIAHIVMLLTIAAGILSLPNIGLFYGVHEWTARWTNGVVDARFIALLDTALESPLAQVSMIPMLAWIAKNAPAHLKATFFAVMASFTNLALSASSLATKYLNQIFIVTRQVADPATGKTEVPADYSALGELLIVVALITFILPLITILAVQRSPLRTEE
jgi:hypothetical protein